jgi:hypothetical protein
LDPKIENLMVRGIMEAVGSTGSTRVLLDIRELQYELTMSRIFERTQEVLKQREEFKHVSRKVAILYPSADPKIDENSRFFETVARNRGLPYRAFRDMESALEWLTGT